MGQKAIFKISSRVIVIFLLLIVLCGCNSHFTNNRSSKVPTSIKIGEKVEYFDRKNNKLIGIRFERMNFEDGYYYLLSISDSNGRFFSIRQPQDYKSFEICRSYSFSSRCCEFRDTNFYYNLEKDIDKFIELAIENYRDTSMPVQYHGQQLRSSCNK